MSIVVRDLVEYSGIESTIPCGISEVSEIQIDDEVIPADEKPDIKQISKVSVKGLVKNGRVIKTAIGKNLDGAEIKGFKYVAEVVVSWRIEYVALNERETMYSITGESTVNAFISLPSRYRLGFSVIPSVFINDVNVLLGSTRAIVINITGCFIAEQD